MAIVSLVDTHSHLGAREFDSDRPEIVSRARDIGVTRIIAIGAGYGIESASAAIAAAEKYNSVFATVGIHPNDASLEFTSSLLPSLAKHSKVVAIGETGLDFYRDYAPRDAQERWFIHQIELAKDCSLPLVIHSRSAGQDCLNLLKAHGAHKVGGVFHCYAEDTAFARQLLEINFLVSFPGTVTFKKADTLRTIVKEIPLSQMMLETDAPFLAPEPFRGKRCESAFMLKTAECIARIKDVSLEELARVTTSNAERLFRLPKEVAIE